MPQGFPEEFKAIKALRDRFPNAGASRLARRIVNKDFTDAADVADVAKVNNRSFYSTYSVIRRHDTAKAKAAKPAKISKKTTAVAA